MRTHTPSVCVPGLVDTYTLTYTHNHTHTQQAIKVDRTHGAMQLMVWAVQAIATWACCKMAEEEGEEVVAVGVLCVCFALLSVYVCAFLGCM